MTDAHTPAVLRHGKLTAELVPLLKAGSSVLRPTDPNSAFLLTFTGAGNSPGYIRFSDTKGNLSHGPYGYFTYIGERDADGWIHAPEGGWTENPVPGMRLEVRTRDPKGTGMDVLEAWQAPQRSEDEFWPHRNSGHDIIAFRLSDTAPIKPTEGVTGRGDVLREGVKAVAVRVARNAGVAPEMCYAPVLFGLQDAIDAGCLTVENSPSPALGGTQAEGRSEPEPCFECGSTERIGTACKPCNPEITDPNFGADSPPPVRGLEPVALAHISLEDDGLYAELQVLNGETLQVQHSPAPLYSASDVSALQGEVERLKRALGEARSDIVGYVTARGSEYEGSPEDAVAFIDQAMEPQQ